MKVRNAQKLRNTLLIAGTGIMLCAVIYESLFAVGAVVACSCLVPHFLFNKCPRCGKNLGRNEEAFCQFCGKAID